MVMTTMSTFLSLTVHCARCHNHKFDPILQEDYYRLQAVSRASIGPIAPYDADPKIARAPRRADGARGVNWRSGSSRSKAAGGGDHVA